MNKTHEFYPMITGTVRTLIKLCDAEYKCGFLFILENYPNIQHININTPLLKELVKELDRQYSRWNKGGAK